MHAHGSKRLELPAADSGVRQERQRSAGFGSGVPMPITEFTATLIGNDANGNLVDKTTGTGKLLGQRERQRSAVPTMEARPLRVVCLLTALRRQRSKTLAGRMAAHSLASHSLSPTASWKLGRPRRETFFGIGNKNQIESAIEAAGFKYHLLGLDRGFDEYRSPGDPHTGANSGHFNVDRAHQNPLVGVPVTPGNMHFGEHNPFTSPLQHLEEQK